MLHLHKDIRINASIHVYLHMYTYIYIYIYTYIWDHTQHTAIFAEQKLYGGMMHCLQERPHRNSAGLRHFPCRTWDYVGLVPLRKILRAPGPL